MVNSSSQTQVYCTRPNCTQPQNSIPDEKLSSKNATTILCSNCGMPLILQSHFIAIDFLGSGGFGRTFKAKDLDFPYTTRVIKQLHHKNPYGQILSPTILRRIEEMFVREATTLDGLKHPRIPKLLAFFPMKLEEKTGYVQNFFYLVQDYIEGQSLAQELQQKKEGKFSEDEVINILKEIMNILKYIHNDDGTNGVIYIHRDIKPNNIMRCSTDGRLYLIDFGAVKQILQGFEVETTSIVLDPRFAPPEQFRQDKVSPASDLYATGTTCLCLLTGNTNPNQLVEDSSKLRDIVTLSNQRFAEALDRMIKPKLKDRPQSAQEVLDILDGKQESWVKRFLDWQKSIFRRLMQSTPSIFRRWSLISFGFLALLGVAIAVSGPSISSIFRGNPPFDHPTKPTLPPKIGETQPPSPLGNDAQYFSSGEEALIPPNPKAISESSECNTAYKYKNQGMEAFARQDFPAAARHFNQAIQQFKQAAQNTAFSQNKCEVDPETLIYEYNSQVAQTPSNLSLPTIAIVIPGYSKNRDIALEILRGVAQALNAQQPLFQILIAKENIDNNKIDTQKVATYISNNEIPGNSHFNKSKILGVIGHYTSTNTWKAGKIYGAATLNNTDKLVLISPTSTGNRIQDFTDSDKNLNRYVFRTASNDETAAGDLAEYMWTKLYLQKALIFYDPKNEYYSKSMFQEFKNKIANFKVDPNNYIRNCNLRVDRVQNCIQLAKTIQARALILFPSRETLNRTREVIQLKEQNFKILAGDILYDQETLNLKQATNGMIIAVFSHVDNANAQFIQKATEIGWIKNITWRSISSYDAAQVFVQALADLSGNSTKTRQDIYSKLKNTNFSASGATTDVRFAQNGDRKLVKGVGVLVQVNQSTGNSNEYGFTLLATPDRP